MQPQPAAAGGIWRRLPVDEESREAAIAPLQRFVEIERQILVGWRDVPVNPAGMSPAIVAAMPVIRQAIVARGPRIKDQDTFERKLLVIRKQTLNPLLSLAEKKNLPGLTSFYFASFSSRPSSTRGCCSLLTSAVSMRIC